jgi:hypothetical protein
MSMLKGQFGKKTTPGPTFFSAPPPPLGLGSSVGLKPVELIRTATISGVGSSGPLGTRLR